MRRRRQAMPKVILQIQNLIINNVLNGCENQQNRPTDANVRYVVVSSVCITDEQHEVNDRRPKTRGLKCRMTINTL